MSGLGSSKVFEDDRVIVWHFDLPPGERTERHTHHRDFVVRVLSGATLEVHGPEDELLYTVERQPGDAVSFRVDGDQVLSDHPDSGPVPATHSVRNVGSTTFREVIIEFKF